MIFPRRHGPCLTIIIGVSIVESEIPGIECRSYSQVNPGEIYPAILIPGEHRVSPTSDKVPRKIVCKDVLGIKAAFCPALPTIGRIVYGKLQTGNRILLHKAQYQFAAVHRM